MKKTIVSRMLFCAVLSVNNYAVALESSNDFDPVMDGPQASQPTLTKQEVLQAQSDTPDDAYGYVENKAQNYILNKRKKFAQLNKQVFMHSGAAIVSLKPTEAGWSDARIMAYQEAQQKAREKLLKQLYIDVSSQTIRSSFKTNKQPKFDPQEIQAQGKLEAILDKLVALTDATLDTKLQELGVDPNEYDAAPPTKRKIMMQKAITKTVTTKAHGDISGSQIMKTYEKTDKNGNTAIAVVIATSNKKKNFLTSLRLSKGNVSPSPEKAKLSVDDYLEKNRRNLMYQYGTKVLWDEKGYPVLLSFGMAGNDCNPADYEECVDNREFSFIDAELNAFAHISESYNLNGKVDNSSSTTKDKSKIATIIMSEGDNADSMETTVAKIIKETQLTSTMTSSVKGLVGIQEAIRWTERHPVTNREVNGVVIMWHPLSEQETRAFKSNKKLSKKKKNAGKVVFKAEAGESDEADDDDF